MRLLLSILLLLAAFIFPVQSPAPQPLADLPLTLAGHGHPFIEVRVNNSPAWFLLDTGAHGSSLDFTFASRAGLRVQSGYTASGGGPNPARAGIVENVALSLGPLTLPSQRLTVLEYKQLEPPIGHTLDGLLGSNLFSANIVQFDFAASRLRIFAPDSFTPPPDAVSIPLTLDSNDFAYVPATIYLSGRPPVEGRFLIDTASAGTLDLNQPFADAHDLPGALPTIADSSTSIGGVIPMRLARVPGLQLGSIRLGSAVISITSATTGARASTDYAGIIGNAIFSRFRVTFDYPHRRLYLEPTTDLAAPFPDDASGLRIRATPPQFDSFSISRVLPGSPAAEAGLRQGDVITFVNDSPASGYTLASLLDLLRQPGRNVSLTIRRGSRPLSFSFLLRPLF